MPSIKLPREFSPDFLGLGVKPKHAVRIRKGHPLANGIIACSVGGVPMDLYTQEKQTGSFPAKQNGSYYFSGDDYLNSACCHALNPDGVTLAFVGDSDNDDTNNRRALSVSDSGNANRRVSISYVSQNRMRLNSNDGTTNVLCDIESVTGSEYVGAVAFGARELWSSRKMISEGAKVASSTESTSLSTSNLNSFDTVTIGNRYNSGAAPGSSEYWKGRHDIAVVWNRDIGDTALKSFLNNPWQILEPANDLYYFIPSGAGGGVSGTGAGDLSAITGSALGVIEITGTSAGTLSSITGNAAGHLEYSGSGAGSLSSITGSASGSFSTGTTGTGAGTLAAITGNANGHLSYSGAGAGTLGAITGSASGSLGGVVAGTGAGTLDPITGAASGSLNYSGSAAGSLTAITGSSSGAVEVSGSGAGLLTSIQGSAVGTGPTQEYAGSITLSGNELKITLHSYEPKIILH